MEENAPLLALNGDHIPWSKMKKSKRNNALSLNIALLTVLLQSVGFTVVLPSMAFYITKEVHASTGFYGWVVSIYSVGSLLGSIFFGWWSDRRSSKEPVLVSIIIAAIGNFYYACATMLPSPEWMLFVARFFVGFGSGSVAVCRAYCSETTAFDKKAAMMAKVSGAQGIGFVVGPGLGSVLSLLKFKIGIFEVNQYTAPGHLSALLALVTAVIIVFFYTDFREKKTSQTRKNGSSKEESVVSICLTLFLFFSVISVFALFETVFVLLSGDKFGWKTPQNGLFFLGNGFVSIFVYIVIALPFMKKLDDRLGLLLGLGLLIASMLCFVVYDKVLLLEKDLHLFQLFVGGGLVSVGYPLAATFVFTIYSKILNPQVQGTKMGFLTASGSMARMLGPLWAANAYEYKGGQLVFGATAGFLFFTLLVTLLLYKFLVPHPEYGKEQSMPSKA